MENLFECKVRFDKTLENGKQKKVKETYLVDAVSCSEAEKRVYEEVTMYTQSDVDIRSAKKLDIDELVISGDGDIWYQCKISNITVDKKSGAEKKTPYLVIVKAESFGQCLSKVLSLYNGTTIDYVIEEIKSTSILDYFTYEAANV